MRKLILIIQIMLLYSFSLSGVTLTEKIILTGNNDSVLIKASNKAFDYDGNYCFTAKINDEYYFISKNDTKGPLVTTRYNNEIEITKPNINNEWFYRTNRSTKVYGPIKGKLYSHISSKNQESTLISSIQGDSIYYYLNNKPINSFMFKKENLDYYNYKDWYAFSENGNYIYFEKRDSMFYLFVNNNLIDSSTFIYGKLSINNNGQYIYAEGKKPKIKIGKYNYMFFIHSNKKIFGPVRTQWNSRLMNNGNYYFSGDDNGPEYIVINDILHKDIHKVRNITMIDSNTFLFTHDNCINVSGNEYTLDYQKKYYPALDSNGNFALYVMIDYYLYKYINGILNPEPISKYGVRAVPLYISPLGESTHYFETDDSIYLYKDEKLLLPPIAANSRFSLSVAEDYSCMTYDTLFFILYKGNLSKPFTINYEYFDFPSLLTSELGFCFIKQIDKEKYSIHINSDIYLEVDNMKDIYYNSIFFDGKTLVFYGRKDLSIYQFKVVI